MPEPPADPWIRFPKLLEDAHPPDAAVEQLTDWLKFLLTLSADELAQRRREQPAPPGWEKFYEMAERRIPENLEALVWPQVLVEKMWQYTTLK